MERSSPTVIYDYRIDPFDLGTAPPAYRINFHRRESTDPAIHQFTVRDLAITYVVDAADLKDVVVRIAEVHYYAQEIVEESKDFLRAALQTLVNEVAALYPDSPTRACLSDIDLPAWWDFPTEGVEQVTGPYVFERVREEEMNRRATDKPGAPGEVQKDTPTLAKAHWKDEHGGIANAIFELSKQSEPQDGYFLDRQGRQVVWVYSTAQLLSYHILGEGTWHVMPDRAELIDDRGDAAKTIFRPFLQSGSESENQPLQPRWLKTREVKVVKNHHEDKVPFLLQQVDHRVRSILRQFSKSYRTTRLESLIPTARFELTDTTTPEVEQAFNEFRSAAALYESLTAQLLRGEANAHSPDVLIRGLNWEDAGQHSSLRRPWQECPARFLLSLMKYYQSLPEHVRGGPTTHSWFLQYWKVTLLQEIRVSNYSVETGLFLYGLYLACGNPDLMTEEEFVRQFFSQAENGKELRWFKILEEQYDKIFRLPGQHPMSQD